MNLKQFQTHFQSYILNNDPRITKNLSQSQQVQIYQNGYYERIAVAMLQDFPIIVAFLGENAFSSLARDYINHYPSRHFNLRYVGKNLPAFLLQKDNSLLPFSELARLEYGMCETNASEIEFQSDFNVVEVYHAFHFENKLIELR